MTVRQTLDYFASFRSRWNRRHRAGASRAVPPGRRTENQPPLERPADAARAHHGHLPRARPARPRRADVGTRSDCPAGIHPDGHRRVSGWRPGPADGVRLDASHLGIRGPDRRVHDHRSRPRRPHARVRRRRASAIRRFTCGSPASPAALDIAGRPRPPDARARHGDCRQRQRGGCACRRCARARLRR